MSTKNWPLPQLVERVQPSPGMIYTQARRRRLRRQQAGDQRTQRTTPRPRQSRSWPHVLLDALALMKQSISLEKLYHLENMGRRSEAIRSVCLPTFRPEVPLSRAVTGTAKFQLTLFCLGAGIFASSSSAPGGLASPHACVCHLPGRRRKKLFEVRESPKLSRPASKEQLRIKPVFGRRCRDV